MNYLAHFHLARANDDWIIGALLGEYVKGPLRGEWPAAWEEGMRLHRHIDAWSDQHQLRAQFAREIPAEYRRYAGIVLDVYCDHWLALHWRNFHDETLPHFAQRVYALLLQQRAQMPLPAARMAQRLIDHDVLCLYSEWETVAAVWKRIGERLRRANPLHRAGAELLPYRAQAESIFLALYPQLMAQMEQDFAVSVESRNW